MCASGAAGLWFGATSAAHWVWVEAARIHSVRGNRAACTFSNNGRAPYTLSTASRPHVQLPFPSAVRLQPMAHIRIMQERGPPSLRAKATVQEAAAKSKNSREFVRVVSKICS